MTAPGLLQEALQQLRDQLPALDFLLQNLGAPTFPLTPPSEAELEASRKAGNAQRYGPMPPFSPSTGLTPSGVDTRAWLEPPPEYSPPTPGTQISVASKTDSKQSQPSPPEAQSEAEEEVYDTDALYNAVTSNNVDLVTDLLGASTPIDAAIGDLQRTALHQAAHLNHFTCMKALLRHGANMSTEDIKGDTPLHLAAWAGHVESVFALLNHQGSDVDFLSGRDGYSPLWCAISAHHIDAARLLLKHGARVSLRSATGKGLLPLHQAAVTGQSALCQLLLERGAQVDAVDERRETALHYASASGSVACVNVLLRGGADVTATQQQCLMPAHWASHKGHTDVLHALLENDTPLNARAEAGATPLHMAANRGHMQAVRLLMEKGADRKVKAS